MIGIIDCGINNIGSLINGLNYLKLPHKIITEHTELDNFNNYILPGVGSFDAGITALKEKDFYNLARLQIQLKLNYQTNDKEMTLHMYFDLMAIL